MAGSSFMHVHLVALRYFAETARNGSMRRAAESLNVAASAVNRQILKLEDQLRSKLFERLAEGVRLTAAGEVLYRHVQRLERDLDRAVGEIDDLRGLRRGHVTLACEDGIARDFLPPLLADFHQAYPGVTFAVAVSTPPAITEAVIAGDADIGIAMFPPRRNDLSVAAETALPLGIITPIGHPLAGRASVRLHDIIHEPMMHMKEGIGQEPDLHPVMARWTSGRYFGEGNTADGITALVRAGLGIGVRTPVGIMREIERREIAFVPFRDPAVKGGRLALVTKPQRTLPVAGALLLERAERDLDAFARRVALLLEQSAREPAVAHEARPAPILLPHRQRDAETAPPAGDHERPRPRVAAAGRARRHP